MSPMKSLCPAGLRLSALVLLGLLHTHWLVWTLQQVLLIISAANLDTDCRSQVRGENHLRFKGKLSPSFQKPCMGVGGQRHILRRKRTELRCCTLRDHDTLFISHPGGIGACQYIGTLNGGLWSSVRPGIFIGPKRDSRQPMSAGSMLKTRQDSFIDRRAPHPALRVCYLDLPQ